MKPYYAQECRYCDQPAEESLLYGRKVGEYFACCIAHEGDARAEILAMERGVLDTVAIDMSQFPTAESRMASALTSAPRYPEPDEHSSFGLRVDPRRAKSAVEAMPVPSDRSTSVSPAQTFLQALGGDWQNVRVFHTSKNRLSLTIDGVKYTVYSRKG